jgi:MFS family permease
VRGRLDVILTVARDPVLARLEAAYLGFNMAEYATWMAVLVYAYGIGGASAAALFAVAQLVPAGLVAPVAAAYGERHRRDRVLLAGYLVQAGAMGMTALALYAAVAPIVVLVFAAAASASFTLTRPVQSVILPGVTHSPGELTAANAVSGLAENLGIFLGPLAGGILLGRHQPGDVFAAFAVVALAAATLVARLPDADLHTTLAAGGSSSGDGFRGFVGGLREIAELPAVVVIMAVITMGTIVIGALDILFVATALDLLHLDESWAGFLYAVFGLGGILGAAATVSLVGKRRLTPTMAGSGGLFGLPIAAIGIFVSPLTAPILFALGGAGFSIVNVAARTLLQRSAPEQALVRVFGALEGLSMFALAAGSVLTGSMVALLGVRGTLVLSGLLVPALLLLAWSRLGAVDRHARTPDPVALELIRREPIFAPLSALAIERILAELTWLDLPAGHVLIREGDPGDRFYLIAEGTVEVTVRGVHASFRGPGDHLGEIALLRRIPRTATVVTTTPSRVIAVERDRFLEAVTGHPQSRERAEAVIDERLRRA